LQANIEAVAIALRGGGVKAKPIIAQKAEANMVDTDVGMAEEAVEVIRSITEHTRMRRPNNIGRGKWSSSRASRRRGKIDGMVGVRSFLMKKEGSQEGNRGNSGGQGRTRKQCSDDSREGKRGGGRVPKGEGQKVISGVSLAATKATQGSTAERTGSHEMSRARCSTMDTTSGGSGA